MNTHRLAEIRMKIDELDGHIVDLLNKRAALSREVGQLKSVSHETILQPNREKEVLCRVAALSPGILPTDHLHSIYREILSSSRQLQSQTEVSPKICTHLL